MNTQDLINYYKALLILQYSSQPNALSTVEVCVTALAQNQIIEAVSEGLDLDTAVGAQLDLLASYRGITRDAYGSAPGSYWSLPSVSDALPGTFLGWASVSDTSAPAIKWLQINDSDSTQYALTDNQERRLTALKAQLDSWDGTLGSLDTILFDTFGIYVNVVDNGNMSITYQHNHLDPDPDQLWTYVVLENVLPRLAGVAATIVGV